ncbi:Acg family FMN-binding oxidoreductase [Streptomyces sp. NBC_01465]|uniref:Acg family FMN-binding oxidoreductase n=1 Tax=Streptomyces sp. NBC_01465 TaxID=2903878 RepID=UPI002E350612|nr:hypothetical protein [Streptomyces sp. NBC_01465]
MPPATLDGATVEALITAASAAPSIHNTQPWRFGLDPQTLTFTISAAPERALHHSDPHGRALHLSVGAALFNLRVAVTHFGWRPLTRLLPSPADPALLATVQLAATAKQAAAHRPDLYAGIERRHTSRFPFADRWPPPVVRAELVEAAHAEGATLSYPGVEETERLLRLAAEAEFRNAHDGQRAAENLNWAPAGAGRTDGLPQTAFGRQDATSRLPMRTFTGLCRSRALKTAAFEQHPLIAVLATAHDRRVDWLRAGQALEHVLLVATVHDVRASLLHQPLEWSHLRRSLRGPADLHSQVQMLIRLGYGPPGSPTPRRDPSQVLRIHQRPATT